MKEQQQLWQPTQQEYAELFQTNKADLWLENKKLKAALQQAAEIVARNFCPANYECTQEIAERCWMEFWMGEESNV